MVFSNFPAPSQETLNKDLADYYVERTNQKPPAHRCYLDLTVGGEM